MIACHRCGKENQDHYKFCLGCGAELSGATKAPGGDVGMMKTMMADVGKSPTPPTGARAPGGFGNAPGSALPSGRPRPAGPPPGVPSASTAAASHDPEEITDVGNPHGGMRGWGGAEPADISLPPPGSPELTNRPSTSPAGPIGDRAGSGPVAAAPGPRTCPTCSSMVPPAFKFCGVCGSKLADEAPAQPAMGLGSARPQPRARAIITLIRPDGSEGGTHEFTEGLNQIGRNFGEIFENDGYLSPSHATLVVDSARGRAIVRDLDSLNGVFVKMIEEEEIEPGQVIRIGQELLRFDTIDPPEPLEDGTEVMGSPNPGYWGKITVIIGRDVDGSAYPLLGDSVTLGRERGEINFPDDGYVSGLHARLSNQDGRVVLTDLGSSNGTFIKLQGERELRHDSYILLGQQLFRLSLQ
jgi:pSer/pThr/pTyr-binding forkhead associated (FHA) protein